MPPYSRVYLAPSGIPYKPNEYVVYIGDVEILHIMENGSWTKMHLSTADDLTIKLSWKLLYISEAMAFYEKMVNVRYL